MSVSGFTYHGLRGRVVFGAGAVDRVPDEVRELGGARVLLISTRSMAAVAGRIAEQLGERLAGTVPEVAQHVPEAVAVAARREAARVDADILVCVGGGSATGLAKAVAVATGALIVAVPTTYAGSEVTPVYGVTGAHKVTRSDERVVPRVVIYDPELVLGLPARLTATSGLNALAHCIWALDSPAANPITDLFAVDGIRRLVPALRRGVRRPDDLAARGDAMLGAYLAGAAIAGTGTASSLHHRLAHLIGGDYGLTHADVHAALLPYTVELARDATLDRVADLLNAAGATDALDDLATELGAPTSLAAIGLPAEALYPVASRGAALAAQLNMPRPADEPAIRALLEAAYHGRRPVAR
jgi:maleylacetate reductase